MAIEGLMKEGFVTTSLDKVINWRVLVLFGQ